MRGNYKSQGLRASISIHAFGNDNYSSLHRSATEQSANCRAPSPVLVVDDHIDQRVQCPGELGRVRRQLLGRRAPSLPFDLFAGLLRGLQNFLAMVVPFALLQADVLLHVLRGAVLYRLRLQGKRERWVAASNKLKQTSEGRVRWGKQCTIKICTVYFMQAKPATFSLYGAVDTSALQGQ